MAALIRTPQAKYPEMEELVLVTKLERPVQNQY